MNSPTLRPFAPTDFDAWYALWRGYQAFYQVDLAETVSRTTWQRLLDPNEPMHGTFALADGSPVGFVHYIEHRSCWTVGNYLYLQDLFVSPDKRTCGVGRALIEHVYGEAAARGCARVYWLTHETNHNAMRLYDHIADRSGFVQYRKIFGT